MRKIDIVGMDANLFEDPWNLLYFQRKPNTGHNHDCGVKHDCVSSSSQCVNGIKASINVVQCI